MEAPIQELEKEFDQIDFDKIMANNQDENTPGKEKHTELTMNVSRANLELNMLLGADKSVELGDVDIKQNQENINVQFHDSYLDRNFPFNDDQQMLSDKKIESLEMKTQVEIHNENSNTNQNIDTNISQPLDLESSLSIWDKEIDNSVDGDLIVIKLSKLQMHTSLDGQVIYVLIILYGI